MKLVISTILGAIVAFIAGAVIVHSLIVIAIVGILAGFVFATILGDV